jgi:hypothetical protein
MQVNCREENNVGGDNDLSYGSCCSTRVSTLVADMKRRANALDDFVAFLCDAWRLGQDHGELSLISLELGVMPWKKTWLLYS